MILWMGKIWLPLLAGCLVLLAIYFLFRRSMPQPVSSLFLWRNQMRSQKSGFQFTWLPLPLNFFLEALAIVLLALAAASPMVSRQTEASPLTLILDHSFSMRCDSGGVSVRDRAEQEIAELLKLHPDRRIRVLLAGTTVKNLGEFTNPALVMAVLQEYWTCDEVRSALTDAMALARNFDQGRQEIRVFTDEAPPGELPENVMYRALGNAAGNLAITGASRLDDPVSSRVLAVISNISPAGAETTLVVSFPQNAQLPSKTLTISLFPMEQRKLSFELPENCGEVVLSLSEDGALDFDNTISLLPETRLPLRVELDVADEMLRSALQDAFRGTMLVEEVATGGELVVTDKEARPRPENGSIFYIDDQGDAKLFTAPFTVNRNYPLTDGLDLFGVLWCATERSSLPGIPLVMGGKETLLSVLSLDNGQLMLFANLQIGRSILAETTAWPVLIYNLTELVRNRLPGAERNNFRSGEPVRMIFPSGMKKILLSDSAGERTEFAIVGGMLAMEELPVGRYQWLDGESVFWTIQVNALQFDESDLRNKTTGEWQGEQQQTMLRRNYWNIGFLFIFLALAVLAVHQYLNRKGRI